MRSDRIWRYIYRHSRKKAMRKARCKRVFARWGKAYAKTDKWRRLMRNPLSYTQTRVFYGFEINEWCRDQINHGTVRAREARRLLRKNYNDNRMYVLEWTCRNSGSGSPSMIVFRRYEK